MGAGLIEKLLGNICAVGERAVDKRRAGHNRKYHVTDAVMSAFAVFFFLHVSLLDFQRAMKEKRKRSNMETLFGVCKIPSDNQIRTLLDGIEPDTFAEAFDGNLRLAEDALKDYRVLDDGVLLALDGVWYYSSKKIHCEHCLSITKGDEKTYYHSAAAGAIVKPGSTKVIPVMPETITNEDGQEKQDCELKAGKRWLKKHFERYRWLNPTLLGDDLYSNQPFCEAVLEAQMSFIFVCKKDSHPWLYETLEYSFLEERVVTEWNGRHHVEHTYKWINGVPLRDTKDTLKVNYLYYEMKNCKTGEVSYKNSWVTNKPINAENSAHLASCGRARWKIENEHNNVLKNRGYNLKHNFGHGKQHANEVFFILNLLAFQLHTILELQDTDFQDARASVNRRDMFFYHLQAALRFALHENWRVFFIFVRTGERIL